MRLLCKCGYAEWLNENFDPIKDTDSLTVGKVYDIEVRTFDTPMKYEVIDNFGYGLLMSDEHDSPHYIYNYFRSLDEMRDMKIDILCE